MERQVISVINERKISYLSHRKDICITGIDQRMKDRRRKMWYRSPCYNDSVIFITGLVFVFKF